MVKGPSLWSCELLPGDHCGGCLCWVTTVFRSSGSWGTTILVAGCGRWGESPVHKLNHVATWFLVAIGTAALSAGSWRCVSTATNLSGDASTNMIGSGSQIHRSGSSYRPPWSMLWGPQSFSSIALFSGATGSAMVAREAHLQARSLSFSCPASPLCSNVPAFRCTNVLVS